MFTVAPEYPADTFGGGDFLTLAARREIIDTDVAGADVKRPERIIVCDRFFTGDEFLQGRPCFSEQTVRAMGAAMGLFTPAAVRELEHDRSRLRRELDQEQAKNLDLLRVIQGFEDTELVRTIYVAPDGSEHPSRMALADHVAGTQDVSPTVVEPFREA